MLLYAAASIRSGPAQWFFDWQGMLSFAATVALVIVTAVYVVLTRGLRNASETATGLARQALDHDRNSVALARQALDHDRERWQADLAELNAVRRSASRAHSRDHECSTAGIRRC